MRLSAICFFSTLLLLNACGKTFPAALGTLERDRIVHNATAAEIIVAIPVDEGQSVLKGDVLVQLDDRRQQANTALAKAQLAKVSARWDELRSGARPEDIEAARAELSGAQASLSAAEKSFVRVRKLETEKLTSQASYDQLLSERDSALARVRASEEKLLVLTNGVREEVLRQAEADVQMAQAQVDLAQLALSELSVKAARDGYLDSLPWHLGERVSVGSPVAVVLAAAAPYARVYIPETWRSQILVGELFDVSVDGEPKSYKATLRWIASDPAFSPYFALNAAERGRLVYLAELALIDGEALPTGLPVQATRQMDTDNAE